MFLLEVRNKYYDHEGNLLDEWVPVLSAPKKQHIRDYIKTTVARGIEMGPRRMVTLTAVGSTPTAVTYRI